MASLTEALTIALIDNVSKPARTVAQALADVERRTKGLEKALAGSGAPDRLVKDLSKLKLTVGDINAVSDAFKKFAAANGLAADSTKWTKEQTAAFKTWKSQTIGALREVEREQRAYSEAMKKAVATPPPMQARTMARAGGLVERGGPSLAAGILGAYVAHSTAHYAKDSIELYREFDKERRFGKAVMKLTDAEQAPLVEQAIRLGGTTKYNDIQVLESQRELAARGLQRDQVMGLMKSATDLGQALSLDLPDAVRQMEGAIFGFKKPMDTLDHAMASAKQTADVQVTAAKLSGMTPEDLTQLYKYGATPARLAGVSEATLLGFGAISKKSNMGGDEAGVAFRALMAAATSPTRGAKTALRAAGLNYADYQKAPDHLELAPFVGDVAERYGVKLDASAQKALGKVFTDKALISDPAKFMPAVMATLGDVLGGSDAKSKKSIAGAAMAYLKASMQGVDVNALIVDLMKKLPGNLALANAIFGAKQGGRISSALGDPETFKRLIDEIQNDSPDRASNVANERMSGFDGAMSRLEGSLKNLETAFGRSIDGGGDGGALTMLADTAGKVTQAFAELPGPVIRSVAEIAALGAAFAGLKGVEALMGGFGLKSSAVALTGAAEALTLSAGRIAEGGAVGALAGGGAALAEGAAIGLGGRLLMLVSRLTAVGVAASVADAALELFAPQLAASIHDAVGAALASAAKAVKDYVSPPGPAARRPADAEDRKADADEVEYRRRQENIRNGKEGTVYEINAKIAEVEKRLKAWSVEPVRSPKLDDVVLNQAYAHQREATSSTVGSVYTFDPERMRGNAMSRPLTEPPAPLWAQPGYDFADGHPAPDASHLKPSVDAGALDDVTSKAAEALAAIGGLTRPVTVQVDTSAIDAAIAKVQSLLSKLSGLGGGASAMSSSYGGAQRGGFTSQGMPGQ